MNSNALRRLFLDYFSERDHVIVSSAPLIPPNDPSLLFVNAGMVPFKDVFLGLEERSYSRAVSIQRCMRAGGKHNDLENVGYTARHHTFFEMLGNFSFGDYFKREAIAYSWKFLTECLGIAPERLWVTVFSEDSEAEEIWLNEMKIDSKRFSRCGASDNFWAMGDTGPCGPCTEIFYDHGPGVEGGPPGSATADGDRYVEIWNLVFMQFQRSVDGTLAPLPAPSVDTGMGLERLAAVMQGVTDNYETDLFQPLIQAVAKAAGMSVLTDTSLRVIADHIRSCAFLISDGVVPGNEGRSYVLRRIMRRAIRHGHKIGLDRPFFHRLVGPLVQLMQQPYPELAQKKSSIEEIILREEQQFAKTLTHGVKLFEREVAGLNAEQQLSGQVLFRLYDTYGFPVDLTVDMARERGLSLDMLGFEKEMERQRIQSRASSQFSTAPLFFLDTESTTEFTGYQTLEEEGVPVVQLFKYGNPVMELHAGEEGHVVLAKTPFYAEGGGQIGDTGELSIHGRSEFLVTHTLKEGGVIFHKGRLVKGTLRPGERVSARVDREKRHAITLNHSATHLLHAVLRNLLGEHVLQKGSLVEADRLRFDFSHTTPLSSETLKVVENQVNQQIRANVPVVTELMTPEAAKRASALAIFGEKYGSSVRVLSMGNFSRELCGGTHVARTGDIGLFKILDETGIAAGIRRIQAVTGQPALDWVIGLEERTKALSKLFKVSIADLLTKVQDELAAKRGLQTQVERLQHMLADQMVAELTARALKRASGHVLITEIIGLNITGLRYLLGQLQHKLPRAVIMLASKEGEYVHFMTGVAESLTEQLPADELTHELAVSTGGKGGGKPSFAQMRAYQLTDLNRVLEGAQQWIDARLQGNYF